MKGKKILRLSLRIVTASVFLMFYLFMMKRVIEVDGSSPYGIFSSIVMGALLGFCFFVLTIIACFLPFKKIGV
jgi:hypothetical protein